MSRSDIRMALKSLLKGVSAICLAIFGLFFFFGGRAIHEIGGVDRTVAEMLGIGTAFAGLIVGIVAKYKIEDIEWEEQNEEAEKQQALGTKMNEPHS